jgi:hypothetical protein
MLEASHQERARCPKNMPVGCQKIQEHFKEARGKNIITPVPHKNAKGVYLRASIYMCFYIFIGLLVYHYTGNLGS